MKDDQIAEKAWGKIVSYFGINTSPHESEGIAIIKSAIEEAYDQGWVDHMLEESRAAHASEGQYHKCKLGECGVKLEPGHASDHGADTKRLDWLENHAADAICDTVSDDGVHHWHIEYAHDKEPEGNTIREAIDAAMSQRPTDKDRHPHGLPKKP